MRLRVMADNAHSQKEHSMPAHIDIMVVQPLVALIFGLLILFIPRLLNYFVAFYLIIIGAIGLWPHLFLATH
jgi:hypothetical protein